MALIAASRCNLLLKYFTCVTYFCKAFKVLNFILQELSCGTRHSGYKCGAATSLSVCCDFSWIRVSLAFHLIFRQPVPGRSLALVACSDLMVLRSIRLEQHHLTGSGCLHLFYGLEPIHINCFQYSL